MNSKEALEKLGNVEVAVTTIRSGITHFKTLKEQYAKEFEVLEKELLFVRDIKPFDVYEEQYKKLEKENQELKIKNTRLEDYKINYHTAIAFMQAQKEEMQKVREENSKLKKVLDILKKVFEIKNVHEEVDVYVIETETYLLSLTKEEYELLKSVLEEE